MVKAHYWDSDPDLPNHHPELYNHRSICGRAGRHGVLMEGFPLVPKYSSGSEGFWLGALMPLNAHQE